MLNKFLYNIRAKDNKLYCFLRRFIRNFSQFSLPSIKFFYPILWWERITRHVAWRWCVRAFYYTPLFKTACLKVGRGLYLNNGMPYINENLRLVIGDNVTICGDAGFQGYKVQGEPTLEIGSNTFVGPQVRITVGKNIKIGSHCLIAARVYISDNDGHPLDWQDRRQKLPVDNENIKPIVIEDDVWIGEGAFICKGVKIGQGAIVGARAVVTKSVPSLAIVAGNPAKIIKFLQSKDNINE